MRAGPRLSLTYVPDERPLPDPYGRCCRQAKYTSENSFVHTDRGRWAASAGCEGLAAATRASLLWSFEAIQIWLVIPVYGSDGRRSLNKGLCLAASRDQSGLGSTETLSLVNSL